MREPPRDACGTSSSVSFDISYSLNGEKHSGQRKSPSGTLTPIQKDIEVPEGTRVLFTK